MLAERKRLSMTACGSVQAWGRWAFTLSFWELDPLHSVFLVNIENSYTDFAPRPPEDHVHGGINKD